jgi:hypothetical protein
MFILDSLFVAILVIICLYLGLPRFRDGIDFGDEGFLAYGAQELMTGRMPNRDFFSVQPPLSFYTVALTFKILGTSLVSLRILGLSLYTVIPLLIYGISRFFLKPTLSLGGAIPAVLLGMPFFNFVPFAVWQGITATLIAVFLYLRATINQRPNLAFPAGVLTAVSVLLRQDQGLYLIASLLAYMLFLWRVKREPMRTAVLRRILYFWLGGIVTMIFPMILYWWAEGALVPMADQLVFFPLLTYTHTSSLPFPTFQPDWPLSRNLVVGLFYLAPAVELILILLFIIRIRRNGLGTKEAVAAFLIVWSSLYYCQVLTRSDIYHLLITLPPLFILVVYGWQMTCELLTGSRCLKIFRLIIPIFAGGATVWFLWMTHNVFFPVQSNAKEPLMLKRGGVFIEGASKLEAFVHDVQKVTPENRSILCLPYQPMFYFLCERRNPTQWNYLWPGDQTIEDHETLIRQAKNDPPRVVLIVNEDNVRSYAPLITDYIHREFSYAGHVKNMKIYLPKINKS